MAQFSSHGPDCSISSIFLAAGVIHNLLEAFSAIVESKCGYVTVRSLNRRIGASKVQEMIQQNLIYLRPQSTFCSDLQPPPNGDVITATGTHALRAMEMIVSELSLQNQ